MTSWIVQRTAGNNHPDFVALHPDCKGDLAASSKRKREETCFDSALVTQDLEGAGLVIVNAAAVAVHVGTEDGGQPPLEATRWGRYACRGSLTRSDYLAASLRLSTGMAAPVTPPPSSGVNPGQSVYAALGNEAG